MKIKILKLTTLIAYILMVATNYLAVLLPLNGINTAEISDSYPNLFTPAGYAFSIWGLIYTLLAVYVINQFRSSNTELTNRINKFFIVNCLLNAAWIFAWHYNFIGISVVIMLGILYSLINISDIINTNKLTRTERWKFDIPFRVYFGWITVATIANITIFLVSIDWNGFGIPSNIWTIIILLVGTIIGSIRALKDKSIPYALVIIWAYLAIFVEHNSNDGWQGMYFEITLVVGLCIAVLLGIIFSIYRKGNEEVLV